MDTRLEGIALAAAQRIGRVARIEPEREAAVIEIGLGLARRCGPSSINSGLWLAMAVVAACGFHGTPAEGLPVRWDRAKAEISQRGVLGTVHVLLWSGSAVGIWLLLGFSRPLNESPDRFSTRWEVSLAAAPVVYHPQELLRYPHLK